ncbi:MAG: YcaQ family DNA glycosylase [Ardenticatenaceae bacterium]|nr:YcaQ family DNA glycosylase [Ardenticatenaceae bacterium]MCB9004094.1 YcaQ family DNA glycosylase [Ardenticatenaceae bacterium]
MLTLTKQDVRRLAISRQHLDGAERPSLLDMIRDLGCVQLDPIRHVERTHLLVLWSRLGVFDVAELERLRFEERALFEYWAHAASLVLTEEWPVHNWYMRHLQQKPFSKWFEERREVMEPLLEEMVAEFQAGPKMSRDLNLTHDPRFDSRWWSGRYVSILIDHLWSRGVLTVYGRPHNNHRVWGLAEEFWPDWTPREVWTEEQVTRFSVQKAVRALGAATPKQIKQHYTRGLYPKLTAVLKKLVKEGVLHEVAVLDDDGEPLKGPWYLHNDDVALLERIQRGDWNGRTTLLSPFDNLICDRDRTEQLFDFYFRIEIYVPKAKRQYGYYVLPILHGDRLIGRIDADMNRKTNTLHLHNVYAEPDAPGGVQTVQAIAQAANNLAQFLGADAVVWGNVPEIWAEMIP